MTTSLTPEERLEQARAALAKAKREFDADVCVRTWHTFHVAQREYALAKEAAGAVTHLAYH